MFWGRSLVIALIGLAASFRGAAQIREPIIDMHMHARSRVPVGAEGKPRARPCVPEPCVSKPPAFATEGGPLRGTLAAMEQYNIVLAFLSDPLERVDEWVKAAPGRFLPSTIIPTKFGSADFPPIDALREAFAAGRLKAIGEIITQYSGIPPTDPRLAPYFALAEELDLPVLIHTLGNGSNLKGFRSSAGHPLMLEEVVIRYPKLRLYFENAGYPFLDEAIALMTQRPQVYADLSTITWVLPRSAFHRYLQALIDAGLGKRLMWGSDQMAWPEVIGESIEAITAASFLTAEQKRDILYNNAARFLRLDSSTPRNAQ